MITLQELKKLRLIHLCIAITFFTSGLSINFLQLLLHICLKPFNKRLFRKLMYYLCYSFYSQLVFMADWYAGCKLRVYMDAEDEKKYAGKEHVLLLMNHKYEIDWLAGWMICEKVGVLGNCKAYAKKAIRYVPCMGWAWWLAEFVFLNRDFDKDKEIIAKQLKIVFSYPDPTWLLLNAEGTRFTPAKHEASVKFAQERGMTPLKHHLIPRTKGFTASLPTLRGICPVIYDINLAFKSDEKVPPTMLSLLNGKSVEPYMLMRRIPLEQVPEGEKEAADWLQKLFVEKDRIIDSFHETGSFFEKSGVKEVPYKICKPRLSSLLNFVGWAIYSLSFIFYYLISSLLASNWTGLITALSLLGIFYWLMGVAINKTQISKASSYGAQSNKTSAH
ncbi:PREDICTED: 1-acyl-sn-glycerol-3-phosphate acyltransferase gamma-like [Drosophila arizonae]|uniref:1-acyl-sn-glycerol-3-phosphate acyltransferase gamma-like n=1 Tax=Drosophila arizonae TaxID=7263 RepID=A0ABM1P5Z9_DROAR|nr:PREDICTED: 1-acyl-sn-glycerol-3-phosphate acyltransferase gamma-like [Drosophila arizonae]XP_017862636.1 PREDICTED: 1-acyl-sn-glycerol-3-phosphate acyltransferase gamma-like [Drosophila arizonae]